MSLVHAKSRRRGIGNQRLSKYDNSPCPAVGATVGATSFQQFIAYRRLDIGPWQVVAKSVFLKFMSCSRICSYFPKTSGAWLEHDWVPFLDCNNFRTILYRNISGNISVLQPKVPYISGLQQFDETVLYLQFFMQIVVASLFW